MKAFAWASGLIGFAARVPKGALLIAEGPAKPLREIVDVLARHSHQSDQLIVPGVPEAPEDSNERVDALIRFSGYVKDRLAKIDAVPVLQAPALDIDVRLGQADTLRAEQKIERRIVWNLIHHMVRKGWDVASVYDGDDDTVVRERKAAMELIFNLDEARLYFKKKHRTEVITHGVLLVMGNGEDILTDWNYSAGDVDGFNAAMDEFKPELFV